jgi:fluoride ion exporter CrcB/FEX
LARGRLALLAVIGAGGAIGTSARYGTALVIPPRSAAYPVATFLVNVAGAVILGAVAELPAGSLPAHELSRPAIGTGFYGGLTTFSAMSPRGGHTEARRQVIGRDAAVTGREPEHHKPAKFSDSRR